MNVRASSEYTTERCYIPSYMGGIIANFFLKIAGRNMEKNFEIYFDNFELSYTLKSPFSKAKKYSYYYLFFRINIVKNYISLKHLNLRLKLALHICLFYLQSEIIPDFWVIYLSNPLWSFFNLHRGLWLPRDTTSINVTLKALCIT